MLRPSERGTYENDLIKVDERLSIAFMVYYGTLFKIFPLPDDANHTWLGFPEVFEKLQNDEGLLFQEQAERFIESVFTRQYEQAILHVKAFETFALKYGASIMPEAKHIEAELFTIKQNFSNV